MKNVKLILIFLMMATVSLYAQQSPKEGNTQQSDPQQSRQQDGITTPANGNVQQDADQQDTQGDAAGTADTPGAAEAAADANRGGNNAQNSERQANTPAVIQSTSSQSGSPAVLSEGDGKGRDGTNTVQRASMNMAGSPANNIRLSREQSATDVDDEMRDRQIQEQDKATSVRGDDTNSGDADSRGTSDQINEKTRRENNAASDQNLSSKERANEKNKNTKRSDRKEKQKKS